ncbi:hypothetical protein GBAR_LOCUS20534, partial [Geodia barretti]
MEQVQVMEQRVGLAEVVRELIMLREQVQKLMRIGVNNGLLNR